MIDSICVDVEIQKNIEELPHGWADLHLMGVSVAAVWEDLSQRFKLYGPDDVEALRERILRADRVTTYNGNTFDFPVIFSCSREIWSNPGLDTERGDTLYAAKVRLLDTSNDLLRRIWQALGKREKGWKLGDVTKHTLGRGKIGEGADAPKLFQEGKWAKLIEYNLDDVCLTRDIGKFIDEHGYVLGPNGRLDLSPWRAGA